MGMLGSCAMTIGLTTALTYPLDLIHTRLVSDMTSKNNQRLYITTFDCFSRTNIDEGFKLGLYKGWQVSVLGSGLRAMLTLPLFDLIRKNSTHDGFLGNFMQKIGISLITSSFLSLVLYPLDTVKRCMQLNGSRGYA